jgi:hypothetical protein
MPLGPWPRQKGKRYFNSSLGGARQEFDEFVAKRTVEE